VSKGWNNVRTKGANKVRPLGGNGPRARIEQYRSEETEQETDPAKYLRESQAAARWGFQFELSRRFLQLPQTLPNATLSDERGTNYIVQTKSLAVA
jgi:hypothetical protein